MSARELELSASDEALVAWRSWRFRWVEDLGLALTSVVAAVPYPARLAFVAGCDSPRHAGRSAPDPLCGCGVWAVPKERLAEIARYLPWASKPQPQWYRRDRVVGEVALWGEILECEDGFRGQYAYPHRVLVPASCRVGCWRDGEIVSLSGGEVATAIAALYGVPAEVVADDELRRQLGLLL